MSELDPYRLQIDRLKFEYKRETRSERRLASIQRRLEILREWLALSQQRIRATSAGPAADNGAPSLPVAHESADQGSVVEAQRAESAAEPDGRWVRMLEDCEIDEVHLPAGVTVRVPQAKVEALLASGVCAVLSEGALPALTLPETDTARISDADNDPDSDSDEHKTSGAARDAERSA